jgi:glycerophosphoryl diester phosphodiesterase
LVDDLVYCDDPVFRATGYNGPQAKQRKHAFKEVVKNKFNIKLTIKKKGRYHDYYVTKEQWNLMAQQFKQLKPINLNPNDSQIVQEEEEAIRDEENLSPRDKTRLPRKKRFRRI